MAVGQATGRISLQSFSSGKIKDFGPKTASSRQCNALAWNPHKHNLLAAGYERGGSKTDPGVQLFDLEHSPTVIAIKGKG